MTLSSSRTRYGKTALTITLATAALVGAVAITMTSSVNARTTATESADEAPVDTLSPAQIAMSLGVTPESAAVAGLGQEDLELVFGFCSLHTENANLCMRIDTDIQAAASSLAGLRREARRTGLSEIVRESIADTESYLEDLREERGRVLGEIQFGLRALLASQVGNEGVALMDNFNANGLELAPSEYRCLDLSDHQWAALASALDKLDINEAAAEDEELYEIIPLTDDETAVLELVRDSSDTVNAAADRLEFDLPGLQNAFDSEIASL